MQCELERKKNRKLTLFFSVLTSFKTVLVAVQLCGVHSNKHHLILEQVKDYVQQCEL